MGGAGIVKKAIELESSSQKRKKGIKKKKKAGRRQVA